VNVQERAMTDQARDHILQCQTENELNRKTAFAKEHGYTVDHSGDFWRVYVPPASKAAVDNKASRQVALCLIEHDAVNIAYSMAMLRDRVLQS
jgi:hypothetical protein